VRLSCATENMSCVNSHTVKVYSLPEVYTVFGCVVDSNCDIMGWSTLLLVSVVSVFSFTCSFASLITNIFLVICSVCFMLLGVIVLLASVMTN
jgi:hypothetical protein